jgi:hypothetical protein
VRAIDQPWDQPLGLVPFAIVLNNAWRSPQKQRPGFVSLTHHARVEESRASKAMTEDYTT